MAPSANSGSSIIGPEQPATATATNTRALRRISNIHSSSEVRHVGVGTRVREGTIRASPGMRTHHSSIESCGRDRSEPKKRSGEAVASPAASGDRSISPASVAGAGVVAEVGPLDGAVAHAEAVVGVALEVDEGLSAPLVLG